MKYTRQDLNRKAREFLEMLEKEQIESVTHGVIRGTILLKPTGYELTFNDPDHPEVTIFEYNTGIGSQEPTSRFILRCEDRISYVNEGSSEIRVYELTGTDDFGNNVQQRRLEKGLGPLLK